MKEGPETSTAFRLHYFSPSCKKEVTLRCCNQDVSRIFFFENKKTYFYIQQSVYKMKSSRTLTPAIHQESLNSS